MDNQDRELAKSLYLRAIDEIVKEIKRGESTAGVSDGANESRRYQSRRVCDRVAEMLSADGYNVLEVTSSGSTTKSVGDHVGDDFYSTILIDITNLPKKGPHVRVMKSESQRYQDCISSTVESILNRVENTVRQRRRYRDSGQIELRFSFNENDARFGSYVEEKLRYDLRQKDYKADISFEDAPTGNNPGPASYHLVFLIDIARIPQKTTEPTGR